MSHYHTFDVDKNFPTRIICTQPDCGFSVPAIVLKSRVNLDAHTARQRCTQRVLDLLGIDREGNPAVQS